MKIVIDSNNVAIFFEATGPISLQDDGCYIGEFFNPGYTTSNAEVVDVEPPEFMQPQLYKREGNSWVCLNDDTVAMLRAEQRASFNAEQNAKRKAAYAEESDPLFFMSQRNEATVEQWQAKITQIKAMFPYQE